MISFPIAQNTGLLLRCCPIVRGPQLPMYPSNPAKVLVCKVSTLYVLSIVHSAQLMKMSVIRVQCMKCKNIQWRLREHRMEMREAVGEGH